MNADKYQDNDVFDHKRKFTNTKMFDSENSNVFQHCKLDH